MSRFSVKGSQVFVSGADLTTASSDFTQNALFVPFVYQTALQGNAASPPSFRLGQGAKFVTSLPYSSQKPIELTSNRDTIIPIQTSFNGNAQLDFSQVPNEPGFYRYNQELGFAFNVPTFESQLKFPNEDDLTTLKNQHHFNLFEIVEQHQLFVQSYQCQNQIAAQSHSCLVLPTHYLLFLLRFEMLFRCH